jgi:hypothetical protein
VTPTSCKAAASPRGGDSGAAAEAGEGGERHAGRKKSVIQSMKEFFMTRGDEEPVASEDDGHMSIGAPFGFKQLVHVTVDPTSASGFNGLPEVWEKSLVSSKISKEEIMEHPDAMLEVLKFACDDNAQVPVPRHSVAVLQLSAGVRFKTTDPTADYGKLTQQLGKGGAGTIFLGTTKKKETFAIKVLPISHTTDMQALTTEIAIMSSTRNAFCVQYFESYNYQQSLYIIMELMDGGSLTNVIQHFQRRRECVTRFARCISVTIFPLYFCNNMPLPRCNFVTLRSGTSPKTSSPSSCSSRSSAFNTSTAKAASTAISRATTCAARCPSVFLQQFDLF